MAPTRRVATGWCGTGDRVARPRPRASTSSVTREASRPSCGAWCSSSSDQHESFPGGPPTNRGWPPVLSVSYNSRRSGTRRPGLRDRLSRSRPPRRGSSLPRFPFGPVLALGLLAVPALAAPLHSKLDARARRAVVLVRGAAPAATLRRMGVPCDDARSLDVFITGTATGAEIEAAGARVRTRLPGLCTAYVP